MRRVKNTITLSAIEVRGLLLHGTEWMGYHDLERLATQKPGPRRGGKGKPRSRRNLRVSDHDLFRLRRVDATVAARNNAESLVLNRWATLPNAVASVSSLWHLTSDELSPKVRHPLAWVRNTVRQAILRGDAAAVELPRAEAVVTSSEKGMNNPLALDEKMLPTPSLGQDATIRREATGAESAG
jgi:hypothetical protein